MKLLSFFITIRVLFDGILKVSLFGYSITYILPLVIVFCCLKYLLYPKRFFVSIFLFSSFLTFSAFLGQSHWGNGGLEELIRTLSCFAILALAISISSNVNITGLSSAVSSIGVLSAIFSILQFVSGSGMKIEGINRCPGLMAHPNSAALLYGSSIILMLAVEVSSNRLFRLSKIFLLFFGLLFTFSISGILVTVLGILLQKRFSGKRRKSHSLEFILYIIASLTAFKFFPQLSDRAISYTQRNKFQTQTEGNSLEWRIARWRELLKFWESAPFFGQGYGSTTNGAMLSGYMPHNEYVRVLVELGIFGFLFVIISFLILYNRLSSMNQTSVTICARTLLVMSAISAITENTFLYTVHAYILAAVIGIALTHSNSVPLYLAGKNR